MSQSHQNGPDFVRHESQSSNKAKAKSTGKKSASNPGTVIGGVSAIAQGLSRNNGRLPTQYINATTNDMLLGGLTQQNAHLKSQLMNTHN